MGAKKKVKDKVETGLRYEKEHRDKIASLVKSGKYDSNNDFIREAIKEKLNREC